MLSKALETDPLKAAFMPILRKHKHKSNHATINPSNYKPADDNYGGPPEYKTTNTHRIPDLITEKNSVL